MSEAFLGEIRIFAGDYAPKNWALCDGRVMSIRANEPLYVLLGIAHGGDGINTFNLPDLRGRIPLHQGQPNAGPQYPFGSTGGAETVGLSEKHLPTHTHVLQVSSTPGVAASPENAFSAAHRDHKVFASSSPAGSTSRLNRAALAPTGSAIQPHENMPPFLCVNFIICTNGFFPSRE